MGTHTVEEYEKDLRGPRRRRLQKWTWKGLRTREMATMRAAVRIAKPNGRWKRKQNQSRKRMVVHASADTLLFEASRAADVLVNSQLSNVGPWTFFAAWTAGLLTSCSPCTLSVLPLTIGYIAGHADGGRGGAQGNEDSSVASDALAFALGLATTMAAMGMFAAEVGKTYGQVGQGLPVVVSFLAIAMGLNLLEVLPLQLPSFGTDWDVNKTNLPPLLKSYAAGLVFALAASPCSTPVLATLLGYVATSQEPLTGGALLMSYSTGYVAPLLAAASATGALKQILELRKFSGWITPASGFLLLSGGTYSLLSRLLG